MNYLFITCPYGFEPLLQKELTTLGIEKISLGFCGVKIPYTVENVFLANYESRIATRVLLPLAEFPCSGKEELYKRCKKLPWNDFLSCDKTFAVDANVQHPTLKNSLFAALVVKDAICDFFRDQTGMRPNVDIKRPDVQLNLFIQQGRAILYFDTSGTPLHKRGWRVDSVPATLHESLAAALLLLKGYHAEQILCDPFCGSGTFLIEAGWIATRTPPGFLRKRWGFFHLPNFQLSRWQAWKKQRDERIIPLAKGVIVGSDQSRETTEACKKNLQKAGLLSSIEISYDPIAYYNPKVTPNLLMTNPPYGKRIDSSPLLFEQIQTFIQEKCAPHTQAHILCANAHLIEAITLPKTAEFAFKNGGLPVTLHSFVSEGS